MRRVLLALGCAAGLGFGAAPCRAQVMDYGGLEAMFGEPVTTSATGSPQKAADAPVNMEIITADDIRRSGADNIPDILATIAGVDVRRYGVQDADVGIRGYDSANSSQVLVLLNGRQIYVDFFGFTAWQTLPVQLAEIRQIEVIKGPNSAFYGFNAVAGVINIVTYDPLLDSVDEVTGTVGSRSTREASGVGTLHIGDHAGLRLSASAQGAGEYSLDDLPESAFGPLPNHAYRKTVYADGRAELPSGIDLSGEADMGEAKQFEMAMGGYPSWTQYTYNREKLGIGSETRFGYLDLNAYRNWMDYQYFAGFNCPSCVGIDNSLYVVQASDLMKIGSDQAVRLGLEYRDNRVGGSVYSGEHLGTENYAADAMWTWQVTPGVALTNSVRLDHMVTSFRGAVDPGSLYTAAQYDGRTFTEPSFNSALVYKPNAVDTLRGSIGRGVQIPSFLDLFPQPASNPNAFFVGPPNGAAFEGSPYVKPASIMNYEVDWDRVLAPIQSKSETAVFYQRRQDLLAPPGDSDTIGGPGGFNYAANIGSSDAVGVELGLKGSDAAGWRWNGNYTFTLISDRLDVGGEPPDSSINYQRGTPQHVVNLGLGRTWHRFEVDVSGRWQSEYDDIRVDNTFTTLQTVHIDNYVTANARVGYNVTDNVTVAVSGQQLNRASQLTTAGPPLERRILLSTSLHW